MSVAAIIVAAGQGTRAGSDIPKQYQTLGGETMLARAVLPFVRHPRISWITVVSDSGYQSYCEAILSTLSDNRLRVVPGGATRQASVLQGLHSLDDEPPTHVLIHDAARPFVTEEIIDRVLGALDDCAGAIAAMPVSDTLKASENGRVARTIRRDGLWSAQTPQGFRYADIVAAHRRAVAEGRADFTDDAAVAEWAGLAVAVVEGSSKNVKVTTSDDIAAARRLFERSPDVESRTGFGYDVHRFAEGSEVWLCGVPIPHTKRLDGHSDADVCLHALTDALLGTIGDGDIGDHFPPSDERWRGAASRQFVEFACRRIANRGGRISNVDLTLLCERPKIAPHRHLMRTTVATMLGIDEDRVGVKATTMERLGFIGREEGIAAMAVATVLLPRSNLSRI